MGEAIKFPTFFSATNSLAAPLIPTQKSTPPYQITTNRVQLPPPFSHPNSANISQYYSPIPRPLPSVILKITSSHSTDCKPTVTPSGLRGRGRCRYSSTVDTFQAGVKLAISSLIGIFSTQKWSMEKPTPCVNVYVLQMEKHTR